ncbi:MAG: DUF3604 domain-containing protein [Halieaceae bacterium]|nr:DUF3604 domain-containing protein [Halieaceae bacterium]
MPAEQIAVADQSGAQSHRRCTEYSPLRRAYFGDLHIHTELSMDAYLNGTRKTPADAYRFARGEPMMLETHSAARSAPGQLQLRQPLDFAAVTDHAEKFGELTICRSPELPGYRSWQCKLFRNWERAAFLFFHVTANLLHKYQGFCGDNNEHCVAASSFPWQQTQDAAAAANDSTPECSFTSFVAYEWTGMEDGANLHRNVIFRNEQVPALPINSIDYPTDQALWDGLDAACVDAGSGCEVLTIPHNSNLSGGLMFDGLDTDGTPYTAEQAAQQARLEPLMEVMQLKGASECYGGERDPGDSIKRDRLCEFEQLSRSSMSSGSRRKPPNANTGFARQILRDGLSLERRTGVNPYKLGFIASTDNHLGIGGYTDEVEFAQNDVEGSRKGRRSEQQGLALNPENNPGGLAAIFAEQNDRDSLFAGLQRRETYGTSGPRIQLRFFGGWDYPQDLCQSENLVARGYRGGVPMGGDLPRSDSQPGSPKFLVKAMKDPGTDSRPGMDLQRVQIIKGWVDDDGRHREQRYDVAGNADNGAGVDLKTCRPTGTGSGSLCTVWADPEFEADQSAWYYARVLENPTCRWTQHRCVAQGVDCSDPAGPPEGFETCCAAGHRPVVQERAYSSPIWYTPADSGLMESE